MSKIITLENLTRFWTNVKSYIDNGLAGKAAVDHTHTEYAAASHTHSEYMLAADMTTATEAEIDALFN